MCSMHSSERRALPFRTTSLRFTMDSLCPSTPRTPLHDDDLELVHTWLSFSCNGPRAAMGMGKMGMWGGGGVGRRVT